MFGKRPIEQEVGSFTGDSQNDKVIRERIAKLVSSEAGYNNHLANRVADHEQEHAKRMRKAGGGDSLVTAERDSHGNLIAVAVEPARTLSNLGKAYSAFTPSTIDRMSSEDGQIIKDGIAGFVRGFFKR